MINKSKDYLVCIDSDGCAFDNMEIKHRDCFLVATISVWNLQEVSEHVEKIALYVNLYSTMRGINRFSSILITLEMLSEIKKVKCSKCKIPDLHLLKSWIESTDKLTVNSLKEEINKYPDDIALRNTLKWSQEVNRIVEEKVKNVPPFKYVKHSLERLSEFADILIVSAAMTKIIEEEWSNADLLKYVDAVAGQEMGAKQVCIEKALQNGYKAENVIMIGDAMGDYNAAQCNNIKFYPIVPKHEQDSWKEMYDNVCSIIKEGKYSKEIQQLYYNKFNKMLLDTPTW